MMSAIQPRQGSPARCLSVCRALAFTSGGLAACLPITYLSHGSQGWFPLWPPIITPCLSLHLHLYSRYRPRCSGSGNTYVASGRGQSLLAPNGTVAQELGGDQGRPTCLQSERSQHLRARVW